jgi:hypothetical protein
VLNLSILFVKVQVQEEEVDFNLLEEEAVEEEVVQELLQD